MFRILQEWNDRLYTVLRVQKLPVASGAQTFKFFYDHTPCIPNVPLPLGPEVQVDEWFELLKRHKCLQTDSQQKKLYWRIFKNKGELSFLPKNAEIQIFLQIEREWVKVLPLLVCLGDQHCELVAAEEFAQGCDLALIQGRGSSFEELVCESLLGLAEPDRALVTFEGLTIEDLNTSLFKEILARRA